MTSCGDILSEISTELYGGAATQDRATRPAVGIELGDYSFTLTRAQGQAIGISPGMVEIGSEQLYVTAVDAATGVCTVAPGYGRGFNGSQAARHAVGERVVSNPKYPRSWLFNVLNEVIEATFPTLFVPALY